jgi:hypothetical protein
MGAEIAPETRIGAGGHGEEASGQSAGRDLQQLVARGFLIPNGEKRGRFYTAAEPVSSIWRQIRAGRPARDDSDPFGSAETRAVS